jgi:hypothetical protein
MVGGVWGRCYPGLRSRSSTRCGLGGATDAPRCKWCAEIKCQKHKYHLGRFDFKLDAARAYNDAAVKYFGAFAWLNPL